MNEYTRTLKLDICGYSSIVKQNGINVQALKSEELWKFGAIFFIKQM